MYVRHAAVIAGCLAFGSLVFPFQQRNAPTRFTDRERVRPSVGLRGTPLEALRQTDARRRGWERFIRVHGGGWEVFLDRRSGLPLLVQGRGIPWFANSRNGTSSTPPPSLEQLERRARRFVEENSELLGRWPGEMVLDREASRARDRNLAIVVFRHVIDGVPVDGSRFVFQLVRGNLVAFGARHWASVTVSRIPDLSAEAARSILEDYLELADPGEITELLEPKLLLLPVPAGDAGSRVRDGRLGGGYNHKLAWRFVFAVPGEPPRWVADVDARTGEVLALVDETQYAGQVRGGVHPVSNDGQCPDGCEQPSFPLPFADLASQSSSPVFANDFGIYSCVDPGALQTTHLDGEFVSIFDNCGAVSLSRTCGSDFDFGSLPGATDCATASADAGPGNTAASRTAFYQLNRAAERARAYLPQANWLWNALPANVNLGGTCNAFWDGSSVNFYRSGGGCRNVGEIQGVLVHEWGHGLDANDGGGMDNPSEAYADVTAILAARESCVGRGFWIGRNCSGYGDTCLDCTGIRDMDWDRRVEHVPATPGWAQSHCSSGSGPCGLEVHCEGHVAAEAMFDLATRDLPAAGIDPDTAWQLAEKLFYVSRDGSGGDAYNCTGSVADGCGIDSWFHKIRLADDDDGNLDNGTPHGAAIFSAFDRHGIACGTAAASSNQSHSSCPALTPPQVAATVQDASVELTWSAVTGATGYRVLRGELGCQRAQVPIDTVVAPTTTYVDTEIANDFVVSYRVEPIVDNAACDGPVSNCVEVAAQSPAGTVRFDAAKYGCAQRLGLRVTDLNAGGGSVSVDVWSSTETTPETTVLSETFAGSAVYEGGILTTSGAPVPGDGMVSTADGDTVTVEYIDADDGAGGVDLQRRDAATIDCVAPLISAVTTNDVGVSTATITWTTDELSDSRVVYGTSIPPTTEERRREFVTAHSVSIGGLAACTVYNYEVRSSDEAGNVATEDNAGQYLQFETLADYGEGPQGCHEGQVHLDGNLYSCSDTVSFRVTDHDPNVDPTVVDSTVVTVSSTAEPDGETVTVTETGPDTSRFTGSIPTSSGTPKPDGVLQLAAGDTVTVSYRDVDDGTGHGAVVYDTASTDCSGPRISNLRVGDITDDVVKIRFDTDEPGDTLVEWGPTPALGRQVGDTHPEAGIKVNHEARINVLGPCQTFYFRAQSTDQYGNVGLADRAGAPYAFNTWRIPGLYWKESFEGDTSGWTLDGEWEIGPPQGLGGSEPLGHVPDPSEAYASANIIGDDLSGLGNKPGDYEPNVFEEALSPALDASTWTDTKMIIYRQLCVGSEDEASIWVRKPTGDDLVYTSDAERYWRGYLYASYDVSASIDGQQLVHLLFRTESGPHRAVWDEEFCGWNIDNVILKDGSLPDYDACGGCDAPPSFAGAQSATDNDACSATGVTISWARAPSWGSGTSGTYAVYRDVTPGFMPSSANLIAAGVSGESYLDGSAPPDQVLYYLVRAENDETCATGPNNGGVTDDNAVYVQVSDPATPAVPTAEVALQLRLIGGGAHVRATWDTIANAASYHVLRSGSPDPSTFSQIADTAQPRYDDQGAGADGAVWFYLVRGANACGNEGP